MRKGKGKGKGYGQDQGTGKGKGYGKDFQEYGKGIKEKKDIAEKVKATKGL